MLYVDDLFIITLKGPDFQGPFFFSCLNLSCTRFLLEFVVAADTALS